MLEFFGVDAVVEEGHVHVHLVALVFNRVGELEQDVAVVAIVTFGTHKVQMADWG